jgi:hypothetical protein
MCLQVMQGYEGRHQHFKVSEVVAGVSDALNRRFVNKAGPVWDAYLEQCVPFACDLINLAFRARHCPELVRSVLFPASAT